MPSYRGPIIDAHHHWSCVMGLHRAWEAARAQRRKVLRRGTLRRCTWMYKAMNPAAAFANMTFVLNHCASPADRGKAGTASWRHGQLRLAAYPNVAIKVSTLALK